MIVDIIYHNAEDQNWFQRREVIELSIWDWWQSGLRDKHRRLCDNSGRDNGDLNEHGIVEAKRTRWMGIFRMEKSRGLGDGLEMAGIIKQVFGPNFSLSGEKRKMRGPNRLSCRR